MQLSTLSDQIKLNNYFTEVTFMRRLHQLLATASLDPFQFLAVHTPSGAVCPLKSPRLLSYLLILLLFLYLLRL